MDQLTHILGMPVDVATNLVRVMCESEQPKANLIGDRFHVDFLKCGIGVIAAIDGKVSSLQLFSQGHQKFGQYLGLLPNDLLFSDSRAEVRRKLGHPSAYVEGVENSIFGFINPWDRFDFGAISLHIQYDKDELNVQLISLMTDAAIPR